MCVQTRREKKQVKEREKTGQGKKNNSSGLEKEREKQYGFR